MKYASIGPIATHFPEKVETNEQLAQEFPRWDLELIFSKTGIARRHIAAEGECASDLGVAAAAKLIREHDVDPATIDFLMLCTQTPDYPLPTTSCLMAERLGLRKGCGALDFNLGCSGYVYGLAMADGLIRTGAVRRVLLITAETYTKYIHPTDRSLRTIFGDGAAATLIEPSDEPTLSAFSFGTDGTGANTLLVNTGGARPFEDAHKPRSRQRWPSKLYMDGPSIINFTMASIPPLVEEVLSLSQLRRDDIQYYLFHQATRKVLEQLQERLEVKGDRLPIRLENYGNTVSATLPILIDEMRKENAIQPNRPNMLIGFGVGWSWAGCIWRDQWRP
ncbi:MAG: ketoacyl-ACP synthase III [Planctomycetales bacterium]|nr:ketoacyl-ACP synthase III [Planctomycetales bacterium]